VSVLSVINPEGDILEPLVLTHGWGTGVGFFSRLIAQFSRYRLIHGFDLPG